MSNRHGFRTGWLIDSDEQPFNEADFWKDRVDSLGKFVAESSKNVADIASHYKHSPERHRLFINGSRFNLQYNSTSKFEDTSDGYVLKPAAGDTMEYKTAERFRYVVGYVIVISWAFQVNQSLQGDDKVVLGYGEPDLSNDMASANGWFWEFRGGSPDDTVYFTTYRDGTLLDETKVDSIPKAVTQWQRVEDLINWYNVGNRVAVQTRTENGEQFNEVLGKTSVDDGKGPSRGNFRVVLGVKADASTSGLELDTGSIGVNILGNVSPILRTKQSTVQGSHSGSNNWEPLFAVRQDSNNSNVYTSLSDIQIAEISTDADVEVMAIAVEPSRTDASSFTVSNYHHETNTAIQESTSVTTFPDGNGDSQTAAADTGGFQVAFTAYYVVGTGMQRREAQTKGTRKRPIYEVDTVIFVAKTDSAMDIKINYETEQQY